MFIIKSSRIYNLLLTKRSSNGGKKLELNTDEVVELELKLSNTPFKMKECKEALGRLCSKKSSVYIFLIDIDYPILSSRINPLKFLR